MPHFWTAALTRRDFQPPFITDDARDEEFTLPDTDTTEELWEYVEKLTKEMA
jgi:hypothetical protein